MRHRNDLDKDHETLDKAGALANPERGTLTAYEETRVLLQMLAYGLANRCGWTWTVHDIDEDLMATAELLKAWTGARSDKCRRKLLLGYGFDDLQGEGLDAGIEGVFNGTAFHPVSFVKSRLALLHLQDDVLDAHQRGGVPYTAALVINKSDEPDRRAELIDAAADGTGVSHLREMVQPTRPAAPTVTAPLSPIERECHDLVREALPLLQQLPPLTHNDATSVLASLSKALRTNQAAANAISTHPHD